ncbi:alkaline phosphatase D family protein [Alishewanella tabrizica]|uniref:Alkaline phosphatase n=1 Tax=Alishewanella tabrizica TaxID=671278 RepID=A0ABQ2WTA1_9ALTE|nr:alkaline phosphatase D family protein [Alishewanella tabrizica]GGW67318.1 alkaline phosphatase [Alishewanella tabrizica]
MSTFSRRDFIKYSASLLAVASVSTLVTGCAASFSQAQLSHVTFDVGVASGDATQDAVILWTRAIPQRDDVSTVTVGWQLARDAAFNNVVRSGYVSTSADKDFTLKIDVQQLEAGQRYYYRFIAANNTTVVGQTRTLAASGLAPLTLAVFSCSNYPAGHFNVYREAAKQSHIDAVIHLGDYLYEYAADGYASENAVQLGRTLAADNAHEILSLTDYRKRYALYRSDRALQQLHAAVPWYLVWDDHEITNDTWHSGAENHQIATEGDFFARRAAAVQAYYEWLPIRPPMGDSSIQIYRSFHFGELMSLHLLDTRLIARDQQLEYKNYFDAKTGEFAAQQFQTDLLAERQLLGKTQLDWLTSQLRQSEAKWQVLGQQVLMAKMLVPAELLRERDLTAIPTKLTALAHAKQRIMQAQQQGVTPDTQDVARLAQKMPYNLDAWDGYPRQREQLYAAAKALNKPLVVLAGDTHNAWHSVLTDQQGSIVGVEFATPSVSSPGMEKYLKLAPEQAPAVAAVFSMLIDDLQWCNLHQRGFMQLRISADNIQCEWQFIDTILTENYQQVGQHQAQFSA